MDKGLENKISHHSQIGGIETSVLDNGPGKGVRIAWFNTGSPLRFKVVVDRAMDICDAFFSHHSLAWISHQGVTAPDPAANKGMDWLGTFSGGLLTTCGLSHIGQPEEDQSGARGLHGKISTMPAEITHIKQPDPQSGRNQMAITGVIRESTVFGPMLELHRTISSELGKADIKIQDKVVNKGNEPVPHMLLYHCNFGYPLVDSGTKLEWKGELNPADQDGFFSKENDYWTCPDPIPQHNGPGEACAFIYPQPDTDGLCRCSVVNPRLEIKLTLSFSPKQLPCLTNWQHWGTREYVTALEPGTNHPIGQGGARKNKELYMLEPGEEKEYDLSFSLSDIRRPYDN